MYSSFKEMATAAPCNTIINQVLETTSPDSPSMEVMDESEDGALAASSNGVSHHSWDVALEKAVPAIVVIRVMVVKPFDGAAASSSYATGFVVDQKRGIILTNRHGMCVCVCVCVCYFDVCYKTCVLFITSSVFPPPPSLHMYSDYCGDGGRRCRSEE